MALNGLTLSAFLQSTHQKFYSKNAKPFDGTSSMDGSFKAPDGFSVCRRSRKFASHIVFEKRNKQKRKICKLTTFTKKHNVHSLSFLILSTDRHCR